MVLGVSQKPNTTTTSICFQSARRYLKYVIVHVDQSAAPQDRSLRNRIVVIVGRNVTQTTQFSSSRGSGTLSTGGLSRVFILSIFGCAVDDPDMFWVVCPTEFW